ncbi:MAG: hypothetical protein EXR65_05340 [Dehalococcoidia bacterium]|nr:hypothetical protein [Dehalococcoidia bacterium]
MPGDPASGVALLRLAAPPPPLARTPAEQSLRAQLAAREAMEALADPAAAAHAVLQALQAIVPYDWAAVLRFTAGPRAEEGAAPGAVVVAVYPAPMAGAAPGTA